MAIAEGAGQGKVWNGDSPEDICQVGGGAAQHPLFKTHFLPCFVGLYSICPYLAVCGGSV